MIKKLLLTVIVFASASDVVFAMMPFGSDARCHFYKDQEWLWNDQCGAPHCFVGNGVKVFCIERGYVVTLFRGLQTEIVPEVLTDRVKEPNRRGASVVERF